MACESCGAAYTPEAVEVAMRHDDISVMMVAVCPACQTERPITVYDQPPYIQLRPSAPVIPGKITEEYEHEWHTFLETFEGDCHELLASA